MEGEEAPEKRGCVAQSSTSSFPPLGLALHLHPSYFFPRESLVHYAQLAKRPAWVGSSGSAYSSVFQPEPRRVSDSLSERRNRAPHAAQ